MKVNIETDNKQQLRDLSQLARERCREAYMRVAQLLDTDPQRYATLIGVIAEFFNGGVALMEHGYENEGQQAPHRDALTIFVLQDVMTMLDIPCSTCEPRPERKRKR